MFRQFVFNHFINPVIRTTEELNLIQNERLIIPSSSLNSTFKLNLQNLNVVKELILCSESCFQINEFILSNLPNLQRVTVQSNTAWLNENVEEILGQPNPVDLFRLKRFELKNLPKLESFESEKNCFCEFSEFRLQGRISLIE